MGCCFSRGCRVVLPLAGELDYGGGFSCLFCDGIFTVLLIAKRAVFGMVVGICVDCRFSVGDYCKRVSFFAFGSGGRRVFSSLWGLLAWKSVSLT